MKIIAVNIHENIKVLPAICATKRAWAGLNIENCKECDFVIGVADKKIIAVFKLVDAFPDFLEPEKIEFILCPCTPIESFVIKNAIYSKKINLSGFVTKYIEEKDLLPA